MFIKSPCGGDIMKLGKTKSVILAFITALMLISFCFGLVALKSERAYAAEVTAGGYEGAYRNRFAFSAKRGWNNDPNGLLYVNGVWHMYYQYNYDQTTGNTENGWGHMSWGHAVSSDLVHWEEKPVAIPEGQDGYGMMFSGSAVYDENNTSGLFDTDTSGKVVEGQGIVAVLTQPTDVQRQILAYSKDGGESFKIYGEVIGATNDGGVGDNEFRDPKVFWNETLQKWLLVVGGGSVRMYSSADLKEWTYLGQTGYWGECPDLSRHVVNGVEKYVLIISPEDKDSSHKYNGTNRADTYYPAEYYVVGDLDEKGLFVSDEPVRRLSEGIDSYAFQSFNNSPDGKVYGVSWSASWKTCDPYKDFRKTHNGGMTVITELDLAEENGEYVLTRKPVDGYSDLRGDKLATYSDNLKKGANALANVKADVADLEVELDFNGKSATYAELWLRVSAVEKIKLSYDAESGLLTLDRSQSSLLAKDTSLYSVPYSKKVELGGGKLSLRILLDRAFISVFANGGKASFFSAVFPSASSDGMRLAANGDLGVKADIYAMNGIFSQVDTDELILSTNKIDGVVGKTYPVIASSFGESFNAENVSFSVVDGAENVKCVQSGEIAYITPLKKGFARVTASYNGNTQDIEVYAYNNGWVSDVDYCYRVGGFSYYGDNGLFLADGGDGFRFSESAGTDFIYSAEFTPANGKAQAAGLVFGVCDNLTSYWVATADTRDGIVKIWKPGEGELKTASYPFEMGKKFKVTAVVNDGTAKIFINNDDIAVITYKLEDYRGGKVGLNVFNGDFNINNVKFTQTNSPDGDIFCNGYEVLKVVNLTDGNYKLKDSEYFVNGGAVTVSRSYLNTLEADTEYLFRVVTSFTDFNFKVTTGFTAVSATPSVDKYYRTDDVTIELSGNVKVNKLLIDGKECAFTQTDDRVVIAQEQIGALSTGKHTVKLFTDKGRPETSINVSEKVETISEPVIKSTHMWLWIDVAIFGSAIIGYIAFSVISKRRKK